MPYKDPEKQRAALRAHYQANKKAYRAAARGTTRRFVTEIQLLKEAQPCTDCGRWYPYYVMQFDHARGEKLFTMARIHKVGGREAFLKELEKCDLVCANCHAVRTHLRQDIRQVPLGRPGTGFETLGAPRKRRSSTLPPAATMESDPPEGVGPGC